MKRPWIAYLATALLSVAAGVAIAGLPSTPAGTTTVIDPPSVVGTADD